MVTLSVTLGASCGKTITEDVADVFDKVKSEASPVAAAVPVVVSKVPDSFRPLIV